MPQPDPTVPPSSSAYVRQAKPSEIPTLAAVFTRAFARDPSMNWFGGVRALVPPDHKDGGGDDDDAHADARAHARDTLKALHHFQLVLAKMTQILGTIVVVVEKEKDGETEAERIVGGALWMGPGASIDPSPLTFVRISPWRTVRSWGLRGLKRTMFDYAPKVEGLVDKIFAARGLKRLDSWYLFEIAVDPASEGKGYCSLLMRDGFKRASGKPLHLEATTPRSRDIYAHFGFELNQEHRFGVGSVDEMGLVAKGKEAVGWPSFVMTKWENP